MTSFSRIFFIIIFLSLITEICSASGSNSRSTVRSGSGTHSTTSGTKRYSLYGSNTKSPTHTSSRTSHSPTSSSTHSGAIHYGVSSKSSASPKDAKSTPKPNSNPYKPSGRTYGQDSKQAKNTGTATKKNAPTPDPKATKPSASAGASRPRPKPNTYLPATPTFLPSYVKH